MPFRITTKNVLQFTLRERTVDSAKEKIQRLVFKGMIRLCSGRWHTAYINLFILPMTDYKTERKWKRFLYWLCYKRKLMVNVAAVQLHRVLDALGRFAKHSRCYSCFMLCNLPHASITRWLHTVRLPFLKYITAYSFLINNTTDSPIVFIDRHPPYWKLNKIVIKFNGIKFRIPCLEDLKQKNYKGN